MKPLNTPQSPQFTQSPQPSPMMRSQIGAVIRAAIDYGVSMYTMGEGQYGPALETQKEILFRTIAAMEENQAISAELIRRMTLENENLRSELTEMQEQWWEPIE